MSVSNQSSNSRTRRRSKIISEFKDSPMQLLEPASRDDKSPELKRFESYEEAFKLTPQAILTQSAKRKQEYSNQKIDLVSSFKMQDYEDLSSAFNFKEPNYNMTNSNSI